MIDYREIFSNLPTIQTPRLILRKLADSDAADMFAYANDVEMCRYATWSPHASIDDSRAFLASVMSRYETGQPANWAMVLKSTGRMVGTSGFVTIHANDERGELGYAIARDLWGQGLATEAARASIDFGFRVLQLHKVQSHCDARNVGSARVMEKAGMTFEGLLRQHVRLKDEWRDVKFYGILRDEWRQALLI